MRRIRFSREAIAVAEPVGALAVQGRAHFTIGFIRAVTGVVDESQASHRQGVAISRAAGDAVIDRCRCHRRAAAETGLATTPRRRVSRLRGWRLRAKAGVLVPLLFSCFMRGLTLTGKGDYDDALAPVHRRVVAGRACR